MKLTAQNQEAAAIVAEARASADRIVAAAKQEAEDVRADLKREEIAAKRRLEELREKIGQATALLK